MSSLNKTHIVDNKDSVELKHSLMNIDGITYGPNAKLKLNISCENLPKLTSVKVFAFYEELIYLFGAPESKWVLIGSTETIKADQNPKFTKSFIFEYYFHYTENLRFIIYNMTGKTDSFVTNDYVGYVGKTIAELLVDSKSEKSIYEIDGSVPSGMKFRERKHDLKNSHLIISLEEITNSASQASMEISCNNLDRMDFLGKSDPYFVITKQLDNGKWTNVYNSTVKKRTLNPVWDDICIDIVKLNSGNDKCLLKFEVFDWDRNSSPDYIGTFEANFDTIKSQKSFEIINETKRQKKRNYKNSGVMNFNTINISEGFSFSTYPLHGTEISVAFAIDFTSANGSLTSDQSLHHIVNKTDIADFRKLNVYQQTITAVGHVLEIYDSDQRFAVYGFGGKFKGSGTDKIKHDFPLNGNYEDPNVENIDGVLETYYKTLETVELGSPTNFAPLIKEVCQIVKKDGCIKKNDENVLKHYTVLTIITAGEISDVKESIEEIQKAAQLPISIIIVGVGNSDFTNMEQLEDNYKLQIDNDGEKVRDVIQFVQISQYTDNPATLASETLSEVPFQFYEFVRQNNCVPPDFYRKK